MMTLESYLNFIGYNALIAVGALLIDRVFGEFLNRWHPVVLMGNWIKQFQHHFYQDSVSSGFWLWLTTITVSLLITVSILSLLHFTPDWLFTALAMLMASTLLAHRMLYDSVLAVAKSDSPQTAVAYLVSRDTEQMNQSDAYKAAIETYAENLSDGVIAPLFFLLLLGLPGMVLYKAINTLDSMVGYRTAIYENYGKLSAKIDDIANYLPARITALLILLLFAKWQIQKVWAMGKFHPSPNAGLPITAMALACQCRLGGPTRYFGTLKDKAYFGDDQACEQIQPQHIERALSKRNAIDATLVIFSALLSVVLLLP